MRTSAKRLTKMAIIFIMCGGYLNLHAFIKRDGHAEKTSLGVWWLGCGNLIPPQTLSSQKDTCGDLLIFLDGTEELVRIEEITVDMVSYKACNYPEGPIRKTALKNVFMIKYANGTVEVFTKNEVVSKKDSDLEKKGDNHIPKIPVGVYPQNIDLIVTINGESIYCYIDDVSISGISYHIFKRGKDPHAFIQLRQVSNYVNKYKFTQVRP